MKKTVYILIAFITFVVAGCENNYDVHSFAPLDIDFSYAIEGEYVNDYIMGSEINFSNKSIVEGTPEWDFGDGTKSNDPNPAHRYENPDVYKVTLKIGEKSITKNILISTMKNLASYRSSDEVSIINQSVIEIDIVLPNPGNYEAKFKWTFPEGTMDESGNVVTESNQHNPGKLRFKNVGSQQLLLETSINTKDGWRKLDAEKINIQIGYTNPAKTIYFACKDGTLRALKLIRNLPSDVKNKHFNLKASSGQHAFNILFNDTLLYVLDAGKQFYYINDEHKTLGDGKISVVSKDGNKVESMASNVGAYAFDDPYYGFIDKDSKTLYFTDRNTGVRKLPLSTRNESIASVPFWVQNSTLGYYNKSIAFGAGNGNITKVGNTWWWGKYFGSMGIFRFEEKDILSKPLLSGEMGTAPYEVILPSLVVKSFAIDSKNSVVYLAITSPADRNGLYAIGLNEIDKITLSELPSKRIAVLPPDNEGTDAEKVFITQMVIDEEDSSVYFGYRAGEGATEKTGLKRYNPSTKKLETLVEGIEIYGVAINDKKFQLF